MTNSRRTLAARYNWCQGPVPACGPAFEKHWSRRCVGDEVWKQPPSQRVSGALVIKMDVSELVRKASWRTWMLTFPPAEKGRCGGTMKLYVCEQSNMWDASSWEAGVILARPCLLVLLQCIKINKRAHSENSFPLVRSHKRKDRPYSSRRELLWNVWESGSALRSEYDDFSLALSFRLVQEYKSCRKLLMHSVAIANFWDTLFRVLQMQRGDLTCFFCSRNGLY